MKKLFGILAITATLLLLTTACDKKQDPETFISDKARPTWTASPSGDMTSSMTAVVKADLKTQYPEIAAGFKMTENDLMAAFIGETCVEVQSLKDGAFFMYINGTEGNVTLRYYSAHYKNIFEAKDAFPFKNETTLGTYDKPFIPSFVVVK